MSKLIKLIGEGRAIFASVLCLLTCGLLAPSALAKPGDPIYEYVCTDNQWETERNPFALPTSLPHWLSDLCRHESYTNYQGYAVGWQQHTQFGTWFLRTNTYYCTSLPANGKLNPYYESTIQGKNWCKGDHLETTPSDKTCLAQIERDTEAALKTASGNDLVGKQVALALCKLLRPHEYEFASGTVKPPEGIKIGPIAQNAAFFSNTIYNVGTQWKSMAASNPLAGQCLNGETFYYSDRCISFDNYATNRLGRVTKECKLTPKQMVKEFDTYYGPGLKDCIAKLSLVPENWNGSYVLHNRDYKKQTVTDKFFWTNTVDGGAAEIRDRPRTITHPDAWPMFDEDVNLDRADVLLLKCVCHSFDTVVKLIEAYQLPDGAVGKEPGPEIQQLMQWQYNFHDIGYTSHDRVYRGASHEAHYKIGYDERIERAFHDFFHVTPTFLKSVDDKDAMKAARASFVSALECFLDADAFITGSWPSKTGHNYGGMRETEMLHLFEFAEPAAGEDGGEWNIAGYREVIEKAYVSLTGTGTEAAVQNLAFAGETGLGKKFGLKAGDKLLDFSGLGAGKDGTIQLDLNPFFDGSMTPRDFVTDVNACVTTNGPSHWVTTRAPINRGTEYWSNWYANHRAEYLQIGEDAFCEKYSISGNLLSGRSFKSFVKERMENPVRYAESNLVNQLVLNVSEDTVSPTLAGLYPSGTFASDIRTMTKRYPATGEGGPSGFSRYVKGFEPRTVVTAENSPYVLEEGKTYTAVPTTENGGVFNVEKGATVTGVDVTFTGNSTTAKGGAVYNAGTFNFDGGVTLATVGDTFCNSGTLNWNLADGKAGCLNGYDKLTNDGGTLRLTVDDTLVAPTNVVLATGDFSGIAGKDTFTITNKTSGAMTTIKVGGIMWLGGSWWGLVVKGGELVLETPVPTVMLSDVPVVDPETGKTNATAVVKVGDTVIPENPDGTYSVPKGYPATVVYTAKDYEKDDGFMFGPGWENKTVVLGVLADDTKMDASLKPKAESRWADVREIAVDTRARKVIGSPNEVLPIAYSTNQWDEVKGSSQVIIVETDPQQEMSLVAGGGHNGYADWQPTYAQYGKYMLQHGCLDKGANLIAVLTNYVYYSTPAYLTLAAVEEGGAFVAITNGVEATGTISVLGFEYVTLVAWADEKWALEAVSVTTNGAPVTLDKDPSSVTNRFEMPCMETVAVATFKIDEAYRGTLLENAEKSYETTTNVLEGLRNNRLTDAETDEALAKARQALDKAIYDIGTATKPAEADAAAKTLDDALAELVDVEGKARFETNRIEAVEGEDVEITVYGGSKKGPSQVTVTLQKNTLTSYTVCYGTDAKGRAKRARFPLVLNWDAGDREPKTILLSTKARAKVEADKFLTLQLGSDAALESVRPEICTVVVHDAVEPTEDEKPYVRALAWPANGGKVSGYGALRLGRDGDVASSRTLKARANRWATFAGWYAAKADDPNTIDLDRPLTDETSLRVGKNTDYGAGTYFAYFTDVTAVASVNLPDVSSATGVELDEGSYVGMVGIRFALPVSFEDETGAGRLTVTGLPGGLKYDAKAGAVTGVPTRACEKTVKFIAKNAAGKHTATFAFVIEALPAQAVGTWNGVLRASDDETHAGCGTVQFTAGKSGSLSAKAMTRGAGSRSFSAKGYSLIDANALGIAMTNRQGETFTATLSLTNDWTEAQLAGEVAGGKFAEKDEEGRFTALRNAFDRKTGEPEALALLKTFKGTYADTLYLDGHAVGTVSFKVQDGGKVFVKAKGPNGSFSGTGSGAFRITPDREGAVQTAVRNCCRLWATDALLDVLTGGITGIASDYGTDGEETCETIGVSERPE